MDMQVRVHVNTYYAEFNPTHLNKFERRPYSLHKHSYIVYIAHQANLQQAVIIPQADVSRCAVDVINSIVNSATSLT